MTLFIKSSNLASKGSLETTFAFHPVQQWRHLCGVSLAEAALQCTVRSVHTYRHLRGLAEMRTPVQEARWKTVFCTSVRSLEVPLPRDHTWNTKTPAASRARLALFLRRNLQLRDTALHAPPPQMMTFVYQAQTMLDCSF